eukprot:CAMPEP_0203894994 /NCGR_PEP_ID=MMETSP0359-20131031/37880_1 /ASSEMBLY_ACC=CAM_ASM_000338 /TAXON_ID=268821 /ORGANISM="Scrippsiella Hangoei, Strain SHTV-5" /LENGTH=60 /DNA_ID=CAMNT_0050817399 /DNA_START=47 /DNA_END=225 /DNA_ORIENTATION=-
MPVELDRLASGSLGGNLNLQLQIADPVQIECDGPVRDCHLGHCSRSNLASEGQPFEFADV